MEELWKRFEHTGRVSDYLEYVSQNRANETGVGAGEHTDAVKTRATGVVREEGKAGGTGGTTN
jgi:hypothetical protein